MDLNKALPNSNGKHLEGIAAFDSAEAAPEFTPVPPGLYCARVLSGEYRSTKSGEDGYRIRFEVTEGEQANKSLIRTWTFGAKALTYTKRDLRAFGLTAMAQLLSPFPEPGREYIVRLTVALRMGDDGIERNDIKRIDVLRVENSPAAAFMLPEPGDGGPK